MINAGEVFAGAAAGGPVGPVFDVLREVVEKSFAFNPTLESVKSTVDSLALLIPQIDDHNTRLGGNRAGEVEKLKEKMEEGKRLIEELLQVNEWSCLKAHYTDQLVELDESLKRHLGILQVQGVIDVKEALVVAKDTNKDVKETLVVAKDTNKDVKETLVVTKDASKDVKEGLALTKDISTDVKGYRQWLERISVTSEENINHLVRFEAALKAGLSDIQKDLQKGQEQKIDSMLREVTMYGMENKVGSLIEAAALGATIEELDHAVWQENNKPIHLSVMSERIRGIGERTRGIFGLIERKRAKNIEMSYIPTVELKYFRVQLEEGVQLVRNCNKVLEWTDDLKAEYNKKFLHLEKILERLHNRLNGIHPFKWNTGKCGSSCGTTSMRESIIIEDRFCHSDHA
ncbi:putative powdery mildew resistance protein, RPW8 [Rosa chinensis]|uniref:Putative powdery mildew resistance protein, RPW8 n=1 Tax=Rosa chinensis TaxID=74649 RepID=A0A2P6RN86_ROSCH|nr:uncharacterized protein LOC112186930 [Rosa chinensis]XP_040371281.1 uncharacterized protein LOC112186930 [Rosa chinensis]PRQ47892.1 putative powdery mildew resistance protein, RPW8 [Rosa chinensis]